MPNEEEYEMSRNFADVSQTITVLTEIYWDLAPVVRKPISANPRLNRPNPRNKFVLRLNSVPRSSISTIQGLN